MRQHPKMGRFSKTIIAGLITGGALLAQPALAQLSSATIRGLIIQSGAPAKTPVQIVATNKATGASYHATTQADGSYVLVGLAPGSYDISVAGSKQGAQEVTVQVGETASVDLALSGATTTLDRVQVVGSAQRQGVKTSEVGTSVSRAQLENLPQINRNFLSFSDLAPGVRSEGGVVRSGAAAAESANLFIDGVSQKNYGMRGGISGQPQGSWTSSGNPFPQAAVGEYKVITQNYKAEYDQLSSAAITAVTKSGTNKLQGEVFFDYTNDKLTEKNEFDKKREAEQGVKRQPFTQTQYGFSLGGPIVEDKAHYFMAYEGKSNENAWSVALQNNAGIANAGVMPTLAEQVGSSKDKFHEDLIFGRLDASLSENQRLEATIKLRREKQTDMQGEGQAAVTMTKAVKNEETRLDVRHITSADRYTNELHLGYEDTVFNPYSAVSGPNYKYLTKDWATILVTGGVRNVENKGQSAILLQDDLTYTAMTGHTIKVGAKLKSVTFDLSGSEKAVPEYLGFVGADGMLIDTNLNPTDYQTTPYGKLFKTPWSPAVAPGEAKYKNNMFGIYLQDDWQLSKQLEVNLGLRWDYEDNMLNNSYVMPADRVAALHGLDTRAGAAPGQTYAQSLAKGGINIDDYIGNNNRKAFTGALAPRLGFSYDLKGDKSSVVYSGWGRAYDRTVAELAQLEAFNNNSVKGEIWGLRNDYKMPYSEQFSLGLRQQMGTWNTEVAYTRVEQHNHLVLFSGNRAPDGGFGGSAPADPLWGGAPGYGNLVLGDFVGRYKTDMVFLKAEKPYTRLSGWGASVAYTNSNGQTTNAEGESDNYFSWTSGPGGKFAGTGLHPVNEVEKHRLVATGIVDLPYNLTLSGKFTYGSGLTYTAMTCDGGCRWYPETQAHTSRVDAGLAYKMPMGGTQVLTFRVDVLNLFNQTNYSGYGRFPWDWNSLAPSSTDPMRTIKLGVKYSF